MHRGRDDCSYSDKELEMTCRMCDNDTTLPYWCDTCQQLVPEKRCHCC